MKLFERILYLIELLGYSSQTKFAEAIGQRQSTFNDYMNDKGQPKIRLTLLENILARHPKVNRQWLYFGEGEPLAGTTKENGTPKAEVFQESPATNGFAPNGSPLTLTLAVPVIGLAACGFEGLEQIMPYTMTASPIVMGPRAFAVLASGESMVPAGIASGHMCFCDPDQPALPGEAVFLRYQDNLGALKVFLGGGEREGYTRFKGWETLRDERGHQLVTHIDLLDKRIDCIAPVICIRRRG